jgi:hypothetical protein
MKRFLALITIALLGTVGFAHLSEASEQEVLLVTQRDQVEGCKFLGQVTGSSVFRAEKLGKARAEKEMINKTERMGGNVILVHSSEGNFWVGGKSVGDAYLCRAGGPEASTGKTPPSETQAGGQGGCKKDTDCKGDRVCESGRCVNP